eukprot:14448072-Alexandrium_andersonii.AAC.1
MDAPSRFNATSARTQPGCSGGRRGPTSARDVLTRGSLVATRGLVGCVVVVWRRSVRGPSSRQDYGGAPQRLR